MWAYDTASGQWAERGFWNEGVGIFTRHRAQYHTFNFGKHLVLDPTNGNVYEQSTFIFNDFGNPLRRVRRAPHVSVEQEWQFHYSMQLDVETGLANFPGTEAPTSYLMLDDGGQARNFSVAKAVLQAPLSDPSAGYHSYQ
jgi:hypothetical protein